SAFGRIGGGGDFCIFVVTPRTFAALPPPPPPPRRGNPPPPGPPHRPAHRGGGSGAVAVWVASVFALTGPPVCVFPSSSSFVHLPPPSPDRHDVRGLATVAKHHGNQHCDRGCGRYCHMVHRRWTIPAGAPADYISRCFHRGLAVLRPASIRGYVLGRGSGLE